MKKLLSLLLITALLCGCSEQKPEQSTTTTTSETTTATTPEEPKEEGKQLNILCIDTCSVYKSIIEHYPDYVVVEENLWDGVGKIGDITVNWIAPSPNTDYNVSGYFEHTLNGENDKYLNKQYEDFEGIDIVILPGNSVFADKLVKEYALPLSEIGITEADTADMYDYTLQLGTYDGKLMSLSKEIQPMVFLYRRSIAKKVLGTSDPEKVQEYVSGWDKFAETAELMKENGYFMIRNPDEMLNCISAFDAPFVVDGKLNLTERIKGWVELSKSLYEKECFSSESRWMDDWAESFDEDKTFGAIEASWFADYSAANMARETSGDWAICEAPEYGHYSNGEVFFVHKKTDNPTLAAEFIRTLCCDSEFMMNYADSGTGNGIVPNNKTTVANLIESESGNRDFLGSQNPYSIYDKVAKEISAEYSTSWDEDYKYSFVDSFLPYIKGEKTYEEAVAELEKKKGT